jgi:hypothetical protein
MKTIMVLVFTDSFRPFSSLSVEVVEVFEDSKLVISQLTEDYKCESESLEVLLMLV